MDDRCIFVINKEGPQIYMQSRTGCNTQNCKRSL